MLNKVKQRKQEGFTIIEVLIVLAIAGLIMLVVFMAVPSLQRNSRNTQRKNDVQSALGSIQEVTNNNSGQLPATPALAVGQAKFGFYTAAEFTGDIARTAALASVTATSTGVQLNNYTKCPTTVPATGPITTDAGATKRSVTAIYQVETSTGFQNQCLDI